MNENKNHTASKWTARMLCLCICLAGVLFTAWTFRATFRGFYNQGFRMTDYAVYTNTLWNSAHGDLFKYFATENYLAKHLSFSLLLIAPIFRVWDHCFLLLIIKWLMLLAGGGILLLSAIKHRVMPVMSAAIIFFFTCHYFAISDMMDDFHGVCTYYIFVPWLYYTLSFRKSYAWIPLVLILGVREDAFIFILPMLLYFALKDRWKPGYIVAGAAVAYGAFAIFCLYPLLNGHSIFDERSMETSVQFTKEMWWFRKRGLALVFWPLLVMAGRTSPALIFVSFGVLGAMLSGDKSQLELIAHFSPPVSTCLACGFIETMSRRSEKSDASSMTRWLTVLRSFALVAVCIVTFSIMMRQYFHGYFWKGFWKPRSEWGHLMVHSHKRIPKDGLLVVNNNMTPFFANRTDILSWDWYAARDLKFDLAFISIHEMTDKCNGDILEMINNGEVGFVYTDGVNVLLERGADTSKNHIVLDMLQYGPILIAATPKHGGRNAFDASGEYQRYWEGKGHKYPIVLSYGGSMKLEPGTYNAVLTYKAKEPRKNRSGKWGVFTLHHLNDQGPPLASIEMKQTVTPDGEFSSLALPFQIDIESDIEFRILGADAELCLDRVVFIPTDSL